MLRADRTRPGAGVQAVTRQRCADQREITTRDEDRALPEIEVDDLLGVAVENAVPPVKAIADWVCPPAAEEGVGPSIMLGEGGWEQGWAGDTNGSHAGRQITIYRPSLKLTNYRIEFQGEIENKSIGWVFRAMDPYNYYAMKLAIVTPGLTPKMALIKYMVVQGHETEVGRVPLDMAVRNDTLFNVRVDVRGSKFSTYVQGQAVDVWTDEQLKSGGVGFLNERAERARVKSASISYLNGGKN